MTDSTPDDISSIRESTTDIILDSTPTLLTVSTPNPSDSTSQTRLFPKKHAPNSGNKSSWTWAHAVQPDDGQEDTFLKPGIPSW